MVEDDEAAAAEVEKKNVQAFEIAVGDQVGKTEDKAREHQGQQDLPESLFLEEFWMDGDMKNHGAILLAGNLVYSFFSILERAMRRVCTQ